MMPATPMSRMPHASSMPRVRAVRRVGVRGVVGAALAVLAPGSFCLGQPIEPPATPAPVAACETAPQSDVPAAPSDPLLITRGPWTIKLGLFAGSQFVAESNGFWGLSDVFAPAAGYSKNRVWNEAWLVPSVRVDYAVSDTLGLYAGLAAAATGNLGRDIFDQGNSGRVSLENAFGGVRLGAEESDYVLDLSGGQQPYRLGSGFLIDLGAQNGNQRGAGLVSPRRSWEYTGIAKFTAGRFSVDAFVLNYNEISSNDPDTSLAGGKIEYRLSEAPGDEYVGVSYVNAFESTMLSIRAPLTILENGREGTQTINPYLRMRPLRESVPGLYAAVDGAYQWNSRIDLSAYAISAEIGHQWGGVSLRPKISYAFREYSGDDPATADLERFDPLFYDGGVHAFASGSVSSWSRGSFGADCGLLHPDRNSNEPITNDTNRGRRFPRDLQEQRPECPIKQYQTSVGTILTPSVQPRCCWGSRCTRPWHTPAAGG